MDPHSSVTQQMDLLNAKIDRVRRRTRWLAFLRGLRFGSWIWLASLVVLGGIVLIAQLPDIVRLAILALHLGAVVWALWVGGGHDIVRRRTRSQWALRCEEMHPSMEKRLVTCVDLAGHEGGEEILDRSPVANVLLKDTVERFESFDPADALPRRAYYRASLGFLAPWLLVLILLVQDGGLARRMIRGLYSYNSPVETLFDALKNLSYDPVAELTVRPGNVEVPRGSSVDVTANVVMKTEGAELEKSPVVLVRTGGAAARECAMQSDSPTTYSLRIEDVTNPLSYQVALPSRSSEVYTIVPFDPPQIKHITTTATLPAYVRRPPKTIQSTHISALTSSTLAIRVETDRILGSARLTSAGLAFYEGRVDGPIARFDLDVDRSKSLRLEVTDTAGHANLDPPLIQIRAETDEPPRVTNKRPGGDWWVHPIAEVTIACEARDDYGLEDLTFEYQLDDRPTTTVEIFTAREGAVPVERRSGEILLSLEDMGLKVGDSILYRFIAHDGRPDAAESAASSQPYFVFVRPFDQQFVPAKPSTPGAEMPMEEAETAPSQREIVVATRRLTDLSASLAPKETASGSREIAEGQRKRWIETERFLENFRRNESIPDLETRVDHLEQAVAAMATAYDELENAKPETALPPENAALQHLIAALAGLPISVTQRMGSGTPPPDIDVPGQLIEPEETRYEMAEEGDNSESLEDLEALEEAIDKVAELAQRQREFAGKVAEESSANRQSAPPPSSPPASGRPQSGENASSQSESSPESLRQQAEKLRRDLEEVRDDVQNLDNMDPSVKEDVDENLADAADDMSRMDDAIREPDWEKVQGAAARASENLREAQSALSQAREESRNRNLAQLLNRIRQSKERQQSLKTRAGAISQLESNSREEERSRVSDAQKNLGERVEESSRQAEDLAVDAPNDEATASLEDAKGDLDKATREMTRAAEAIGGSRDVEAAANQDAALQTLSEAEKRIAALMRSQNEDPLRRFQQALQAVREFQQSLGPPDEAPQPGDAQQAEGGEGPTGENPQQGQGQGRPDRNSQTSDAQQPGPQGSGRPDRPTADNSRATARTGQWTPTSDGTLDTPHYAPGDAIVLLRDLDRTLPAAEPFEGDLEQIRRLVIDLEDRQHPAGRAPVLVGRLRGALDNLVEDLLVEIGRIDQLQRLQHSSEEVLPPEFRDLAAQYFENLGADESSRSR
ncbi:hypothetical protein JW916_06950 [Candidatus Sumerlaeota bacterium]|nr:hypothetical protein [Candidatus Sumerlaeota bacterium]